LSVSYALEIVFVNAIHIQLNITLPEHQSKYVVTDNKKLGRLSCRSLMEDRVQKPEGHKNSKVANY
jgi:hypothetical protein